MTTIRVSAAVNRAFALTDVSIHNNLEKQCEFRKQIILADKSLTYDEKLEAIKKKKDDLSDEQKLLEKKKKREVIKKSFIFFLIASYLFRLSFSMSAAVVFFVDAVFCSRTR